MLLTYRRYNNRDDRTMNYNSYDELANFLDQHPEITTLSFDDSCELTTLPPLPQGLIHLHCNDTCLQSISALPITIKMIILVKNKNLAVLPDLINNINMTAFACPCNGFTYLPKLPLSIKYVDVSFNHMTYLPQLDYLSNLDDLRVGNNPLTTIPPLPQNVTVVDCRGCKLNDLPQLPSKLSELYCFDNTLSSLQQLPETMITLNCMNNNIMGLYDRPDIIRIKCQNISNQTHILTFPSIIC